MDPWEVIEDHHAPRRQHPIPTALALSHGTRGQSGLEVVLALWRPTSSCTRHVDLETPFPNF